MDLKKKGCLLQSTERGQIGWALGLWFMLFLGILLCALLQLEIFRASSQYMEDALAASNLAAAVIDVEEYGISHKLQIHDTGEAYDRYRKAVRANLSLNDLWECENKGLISGPVRIENFTVYNVSGSQVEVCSFGENGTEVRRYGTLGSETAPNGMKVENTGIYSEISYRIKGVLGIEVTARKGKLVDVVKSERNF
ncbi:MAG: hypothetical protein NC123_09280 [Butyrivibrio sp.]|nr:hypothetical protein [Acetatifactor muris]MCM1559726.1 hypothetical protein [Butyrivibrio sp.]